MSNENNEQEQPQGEQLDPTVEPVQPIEPLYEQTIQQHPVVPPYLPPQQASYYQPIQPAPVKEASKRSFGVGFLASVAAIAAVVGGGVGAGTVALVDSFGRPAIVGNPNQTPVNINISDTNQVVAAVALKASKSVVTVNLADGLGSGIIISEDGYVITNAHVVAIGGAISVTASDGRIYAADVVGSDPLMDIAVIKLRGASGLTPIEFADSSEVAVGDIAVVIGAPLGYEHSVTSGVISSIDRSIQVEGSAPPEDDEDEDDRGDSPWYFDLPGNNNSNLPVANVLLPVFQTDAAINPGNSGGALLDQQGRLIGVNVAIARTGDDSSYNVGLGFAIPSNVAKRVAEEIIEHGSASHGLLGAMVEDSTNDIAGAYIASLTPGGALANAGLQPGDVITKFDGVTIWGQRDIAARARSTAPGIEVSLQYWRSGELYDITVTLGDLQDL